MPPTSSWKLVTRLCASDYQMVLASAIHAEKSVPAWLRALVVERLNDTRCVPHGEEREAGELVRVVVDVTQALQAEVDLRAVSDGSASRADWLASVVAEHLAKIGAPA